MEMLEFLGTFETSGGKMIDPLKLSGRSQDTTKTTRPSRGRLPAKTGDPNKREKKDESND